MDAAVPPQPTRKVGVESGARSERDPEVPTLPTVYAWVGDGDEVPSPRNDG